ncbi:integrase core domain-containing protein [Streptomyces sp. NPDC001340]
MQTAWAYRKVFISNDQRARALAPWLDFYNTGRRHRALGSQPPMSWWFVILATLPVLERRGRWKSRRAISERTTARGSRMVVRCRP